MKVVVLGEEGEEDQEEVEEQETGTRLPAKLLILF